MLNVWYGLVQMMEFLIGVYLLTKLYPVWRFRNRISKTLFVILILGMGLLNAYNASLALLSTLFVIVGGLITAGIFCIFIKSNYWQIAISQLSYSINVAFLKMPILIMRGIVEKKNLEHVNCGERCFTELIWCVAINLFFVLCVARKEAAVQLLKQLYQKKWRMGIVVSAQWCFLTYNMWLGEQGFQAVDLIVNISLIVTVSLAFQCFMLYITYKHDTAEKIMLDAAQYFVQDHFSELRELYTCNNQKMHDVKHHMLYLANCLEQKEYVQAKEYICNYLESFNLTQKKVWTGFPFLDFIIDYKRMEMKDKGIQFTLDIDLYEYPLDDAELGVLLGNLLDNAIEAAYKCTEKRDIYLCIKNVNKMFMLNLKNTSNMLPNEREGRFITHKKDKITHGLGIENVKRIVEKYQGSISFQYDSEEFCVNIII